MTLWRRSLDNERADIEEQERGLQARREELHRKEEEYETTMDKAKAVLHTIRDDDALEGLNPGEVKELRPEVFALHATFRAHELLFEIEVREEGSQVKATHVFPNSQSQALPPPTSLADFTPEWGRERVKDFRARVQQAGGS